MSNGNVTNVEHVGTGVNVFKSMANYTCLEGYELPDGSVSQTSYCQQSKKWQETENCSGEYKHNTNDQFWP